MFFSNFNWIIGRVMWSERELSSLFKGKSSFLSSQAVQRRFSPLQKGKNPILQRNPAHMTRAIVAKVIKFFCSRSFFGPLKKEV
jgi:hypothetical protein